MAVTNIDLIGLSRKRRVRSLHRWFATLQRQVNKPERPNTPGTL